MAVSNWEAAVESERITEVAKYDTGEAMCPYCGTRYRLKGGPRKGAH